MNLRNKKFIVLILILLSFSYFVVSNSNFVINNKTVEQRIKENGYYTSKDEVALYIHIYQKLPRNFITKEEAAKLGFLASKKNLWQVTDRMSIGGDRFFNREQLLPNKIGRQYFEADIDFKGGYRNSKRIVYSNDGLIYYTDDHYDSFTLLFGDE